MRKNAKFLWVVAVAGVIAVSAGCAPNGGNNGTQDSGSVAEEAQATGKMLSLTEYAELYPLQTNSWLTVVEGKNTMGAMRDDMIAMKGDGLVPIQCGSCHSADFGANLDENGDAILDMVDENNEVEYMGCGLCHDEDLESGTSAHNRWGGMMVPEWASLFSTGEAVCGQCHMLFTANAYLHPEYRGQDFYKYGTEADELRQAMREIYDANPIAAEDAGIGTPYIDEETGAWIYGWGAHPVLEAFQGSKHQSMGVDCVSCHMQKTTAEDGTTYTNHFAAGSPLENPEAVEYCLTCHKAQGIEDADAMVKFVRDKQETLAAKQFEVRDDIIALHDVLAQAKDDPNIDQAVLADARETYSIAYWRFLYETGYDTGRLTEDHAGKMAAHDFDGSMDLLEDTQAIVRAATASLQ